jgi:hypothetical protein
MINVHVYFQATEETIYMYIYVYRLYTIYNALLFIEMCEKLHP